MLSDWYDQLYRYLSSPASGSLATHVALILALITLSYQKSSFSWQSKSNSFEKKQDVFERYLSHSWLIFFELQSEIIKSQFKFETSKSIERNNFPQNYLESNLTEIRMARYSSPQVDKAIANWVEVVSACRIELKTLSQMLESDKLDLTSTSERQNQFETIRNFNSLLQEALEGLEKAFATELLASRPKTFWNRVRRRQD